ncbi:hypothetical protein LINPERPRIM_LOCUS32390 [Linum perenne]
MDAAGHRDSTLPSSLTIPFIFSSNNDDKNYDDDDHDDVGGGDNHKLPHYHNSTNEGGTSTFFSTCFNGLNALSGLGILPMNNDETAGRM